MASNVISFPAQRVTPIAANDNDLPPAPVAVARRVA